MKIVKAGRVYEVRTDAGQWRGTYATKKEAEKGLRTTHSRRKRARSNPGEGWLLITVLTTVAGVGGYFLGQAQAKAATLASASVNLVNGGAMTAPANGTWILNLPAGASWVSLTDPNSDVSVTNGATGPATITGGVAGTVYTATWNTTAASTTTTGRNARNSQQTATITAQ
jgi:hypothetical protein